MNISLLKALHTKRTADNDVSLFGDQLGQGEGRCGFLIFFFFSADPKEGNKQTRRSGYMEATVRRQGSGIGLHLICLLYTSEASGAKTR